jgi:hypothetical protein
MQQVYKFKKFKNKKNKKKNIYFPSSTVHCVNGFYIYTVEDRMQHRPQAK